jgi:hypothetical protein
MKKIYLIVFLSFLQVFTSSCSVSERVTLKGSLEGGLFLPGISHLEYYVCLKYKSDILLMENLGRSSDFANYSNQDIKDIEVYNLIQRKAIHMEKGCNSSQKDWDKFNSEIRKYNGKKFSLGFPSASSIFVFDLNSQDGFDSVDFVEKKLNEFLVNENLTVIRKLKK